MPWDGIIIAAISVGLGALALWTSERRYWNYQQDRQYDDWMLRQKYTRRDSRRQAMEALVTDMNRTVEEIATATHLALSATLRRHQAEAQKRRDEVAARQHAESEAIGRFNEAERVWLTAAPVLGGKLHLVFGDPEADKRWKQIEQTSFGACEALNQARAGDDKPAWELIGSMRHDRDALLEELESAIDRFVRQELEPGRARRSKTPIG